MADSSPPTPRPRRLPTYRALFAVDVKDFSGFEGGDHAELTSRIRPIVAAAFRRCELHDLWEEETWNRIIGDSYVAAFPSSALPFLLNPLLGALQVQLEHENRTAPIGHPPRPLRMRASVHVGPVTDPAGDPSTDGSGAARVETHRLLDADEVKDILSRSGESTCVAAIVSDRAFTDAVMSGYSGQSLDSFTPVDITVKNFQGRAHLAVPLPSGDLLAHGVHPLTTQPPTVGTSSPVSGPDRSIERVGRDAVLADDYHDHRVTGIGVVRGSATNTFTGNTGAITVTGNGEESDGTRTRRRKPRHD